MCVCVPNHLRRQTVTLPLCSLDGHRHLWPLQNAKRFKRDRSADLMEFILVLLRHRCVCSSEQPFLVPAGKTDNQCCLQHRLYLYLGAVPHGHQVCVPHTSLSSLTSRLSGLKARPRMRATICDSTAVIGCCPQLARLRKCSFVMVPQFQQKHFLSPCLPQAGFVFVNFVSLVAHSAASGM